MNIMKWWNETFKQGGRGWKGYFKKKLTIDKFFPQQKDMNVYFPKLSYNQTQCSQGCSTHLSNI